MAERKDIAGQQFGWLKAVKPTAKRERGSVCWECLCKCGKLKVVSVRHLVSGNTKSCGCLNIAKTVVRNRTRTGSRNPMWGGGRMESGGYIYIYSPDHPRAIGGKSLKLYVAEHRLVMEEKLGRYLKPGEIVHHIDGNSVNNIPENLHLFTNSSAHFRWHRRLNEIALYD